MAKLSVTIYDLAGQSVGTLDLNPTIFNVEPNPTLLHQAVVSFLANRRAGTAHTKGRGEVRGSNRKPWKQKGTGNARASSTRSPLWRGGGTTFGPLNVRNFSVRMPQKMRQNAFKIALSEKVTNENLVVVDALTNLDGKTKSWVTAISKLPKADQKALIVSTAKEDLADRSIRNVPKHKYVSLESVTIFDLTSHPALIMTKDALEGLTNRLVSTTDSKTVATPGRTKLQAKATAGSNA